MDADHDSKDDVNCSAGRGGAGWWWGWPAGGGCGAGGLNGKYAGGPYTGLVWWPVTRMNSAAASRMLVGHVCAGYFPYLSFLLFVA